MDENEFNIPFFRESNFLRKRCSSCGSHFWTQDPSRELCGDAPCEKYSFIGNPPTARRYTVDEMRRAFISFFERKGHSVIKPYPVVARWRDDVYFVGASIYNFQPYVTEGVLPPPANPLVVSQPCIRFTDIDNVCLTFGRHLLIFEMGGHHAFNYPDRSIYWKDETVRFHHEFLTKDVGVKSDQVTYKEHFWSGGGNAGPDVEVCVSGLEISTLVFMVYKVVGERLVELPIKTVDTGYGMERWSWLSQGSSTCFQTVYGSLLDRLLKLSGVDVDEKMLGEIAVFSSAFNTETIRDRTAFRKHVSTSLNLDLDELNKVLTPVESAYAVADHTKALAFMLAEGIVPSNTHIGYLARLLIRKTYRMLKVLEIEDKLLDIVDMQISLWSRDFPNLKEVRGEILDALSAEEEKFRKTLVRGAELVRRVARQSRASGVSKLPYDTLVKLYDSHGLVPEMVKELALEEKVEVSVPSNFYALVAESHSKATVEKEPPFMKEHREKLSALPPTKTLFYSEPHRKNFEAETLASFDNRYVVLDQTCFYAEGGGQPADRGTLSFGSSTVNVVDAQKVGIIIVHVVEGEAPEVGVHVSGEVDWDRRSSLMRHHTATHIIIGAARRVLGEHAWQSGAQKDVESSRLDISHYRKISDEEIREIERLACEVAVRNLPVETMWLPRDEAEQRFGFRIYQGGVVPGREVRIVKVGDWDVEACGGVHCRSTGEVGFIKISGTDRIQDGVERLTFAAGPAALKLIQRLDVIASRSAETLGVPLDKLDVAVKSLTERAKELEKNVEKLRLRIAQREADEIASKSRRIAGLKLAVSRRTLGDEIELIDIGNRIAEQDPLSVSVLTLVRDNVRVVVVAGQGAVKKGFHAGRMADKLAKVVGGGGGGKPNFGQGGGPNVKKAATMLRQAGKFLKELMR